MGETKREVTELLGRLSAGEKAAEEELFPLVYRELHYLAAWRLRSERPGHTLQATALVNEAYIRLCKTAKVDWKDRAHFFAVAARVMRNILTDYARKKKAQGAGKAGDIDLDQLLVISPRSAELSLVIDDLLEKLSKNEARQASVVELRFFGGLTEDEIAEVLGVSSRTVIRDWLMARAWLQARMERE